MAIDAFSSAIGGQLFSVQALRQSPLQERAAEAAATQAELTPLQATELPTSVLEGGTENNTQSNGGESGTGGEAGTNGGGGGGDAQQRGRLVDISA